MSLAQLSFEVPILHDLGGALGDFLRAFGTLMVVGVEGYLALNLAYLLLTLVGAALARRFPRSWPDPIVREPLRFAVLIAARDEARVIGQAVASVAAQEYGGRVRVVVVADHCRDDTAAQAKLAGAQVIERNAAAPRDRGGSPGSTKGRALAWLWSELTDRDAIDAVVVLDADNVAGPGFLSAMDRELARGFSVVQGVRVAKNPEASHASRLDGLAEALNQRVEAAGRRWWGLSGPLSGSGMAFMSPEFSKLLANVSDSLVEDCEWQLLLLQGRVTIHWAEDAVIYDEKVARYADIPAQRSRWLRGKATLVRRYLPDLLLQALRGRPGAAQGLLYLLVILPRSVLGVAVVTGALLALLRVPLPGLAPAWAWGAGLLGLVTYLAGAVALVRPGQAFWRSLPHLPRFLVTLLLAFFLAPFRRGDWIATPHRGGQERR